ncbi:hypothetical protein ACFQE8_24225 [Salinirubellus sp. GCM10025818]|uniref:hypothetical protein n=1 Tax=Salinirubellus TaxID=2162630 RepID=UPI0030D091D5
MEHVHLTIPERLLELLPEDGANAARDMERAVEGYERAVNRAIDAGGEGEVDAGELLDVIEHMETRMKTYDEFVPELRAWGQSPAYAVSWRDLHASLVEQLHEHEDLTDRLDRERNYRLVDDGIRLKDLKED